MEGYEYIVQCLDVEGHRFKGVRIMLKDGCVYLTQRNNLMTIIPLNNVFYIEEVEVEERTENET